MKFNAYYNRAVTDMDGNIEISFLAKNGNRHLAKYAVEALQAKQDKLLTIDTKEYRKARSLNANAYLWVLLEKMARVLKTSKDELYIVMLERYGVFTHLVVKQNVVDRVKAEWRTVRELGEVNVNGQIGIQLQCFFGSSGYDTKEMARLIDGVVSECKELKIETLSDTEIRSLQENWGK